MIIACLVSIVWHLFCFQGIEFTLGRNHLDNTPFINEVCFLGGVLQHEASCFRQQEILDNSLAYASVMQATNRLEKEFIEQPFDLFLSQPLYVQLSHVSSDKTDFKKITHSPKNSQSQSSILFSPRIPYRFLAYFQNRQEAHVEVAFYVSRQGKITAVKRKVSSGNPEVDLLIMRNLTHFLNLSRSHFALESWQTVKVDLKP